MSPKGSQTSTLLAREYLIAWISQDLGCGPDIHIYGNATGLRNLAAILLKIADFDQSQGRYPDEDSLHCHFRTGLNTTARDDLPRLTVGRVEPKSGSAAIRDGFPELDPSSNSQALSDMNL